MNISTKKLTIDRQRSFCQAVGTGNLHIDIFFVFDCLTVVILAHGFCSLRHYASVQYEIK